MTDIFTKITETSIKVTRTSEPVVTESVYDYNQLLEQKVAITKQRDEMISIKDKELAEVDALLAQCEKLGITAKPVEEPIEVTK